MIFLSPSQKKRNELGIVLLKGIIGKWPSDVVWRHQLHNHPTGAALAAKLLNQSPDEREMLTGCQIQTLWSKAEKRTKGQTSIWVQLQEPMLLLSLNENL